MSNFYDFLKRREVSVEPDEYYYDYEGSLNDYDLEDVYLYEIKFNRDTKRYEVTEEVWKNPVGWRQIKFNGGEKYTIDQGPVYVSTHATWAVRRKLTEEEIKGFLRRGLKSVIEEECARIQTRYEKEIAETKAYLNADVVKVSSKIM